MNPFPASLCALVLALVLAPSSLGAQEALAPATPPTSGPVSAPAAADRSPIPIVFPQVREPYRTAFLSIVEGISAELGTRANVQEVDSSLSAAQVSERLGAHASGTVVLLGKYGLDMSHEMGASGNRVVGAVLARPDQLQPGTRGISMLPSPEKLFRKLRELAPNSARITVVYGDDDNDWLITRAAADAEALGYGFQALKRDNLRDGANAYREVLARLAPATDALWLLQASPFLREDSVLQMILRTAWDRNLVVFSSNLAHVPKGALFALFPDNAEMGRALGRLALGGESVEPGLQLLEQLDTAINIRTANHLGLGLNATDARFDLVFPSR